MSLVVLAACQQPAPAASPTTAAPAATPTEAMAAASPTAATQAPSTPTGASPAGTPATVEAPPLTQEYRLSFATGGTGGTYYPFGGAVANVISQNLQGVSVNVEAHGRLG